MRKEILILDKERRYLNFKRKSNSYRFRYQIQRQIKDLILKNLILNLKESKENIVLYLKKREWPKLNFKKFKQIMKTTEDSLRIESMSKIFMNLS